MSSNEVELSRDNGEEAFGPSVMYVNELPFDSPLHDINTS